MIWTLTVLVFGFGYTEPRPLEPKKLHTTFELCITEGYDYGMKIATLANRGQASFSVNCQKSGIVPQVGDERSVYYVEPARQLPPAVYDTAPQQFVSPR